MPKIGGIVKNQKPVLKCWEYNCYEPSDISCRSARMPAAQALFGVVVVAVDPDGPLEIFS